MTETLSPRVRLAMVEGKGEAENPAQFVALKVREEREVHPVNASELIAVTSSGMTTDVREEHPVSAFASMEVTEFGIE